MENQDHLIRLSRDAKAQLIPTGDPVILQKGQLVKITQALGGSYTLFINGNLVKLAGEDADAIGHEPKRPPVVKDSGEHTEVNESDIWDRLKMVFDPEIPVNIVDLGLVYELVLTPSDDGGTDVVIKMTLTAPGCGMGPSIAADAEYKVNQIPGVKSVHVELVWEPLWHRDMMSDEAKLQLGML